MLDRGNINGRMTRALMVALLHKDDQGKDLHQSFSISLVGKINNLEQSTQPNLAYAVHECACFISSLRISW
jgi:hypothetical protein